MTVLLVHTTFAGDLAPTAWWWSWLLGCVCSLFLFVGPAHALDKKGLGWAESAQRPVEWMHQLQLHWFYNWGPTTSLVTHMPFVPMAFGLKSVAKIPVNATLVLGFNEPDNRQQSNMSVEQAHSAWPGLGRAGRQLGSPATAQNPLNENSWLRQFMTLSAADVGFVTVHWYKGLQAKKFIEDIQGICNAFGKPVWVTEFAPQTAAQARAKPTLYSNDEVKQFMTQTTAWMNQSPCVQRYAWHDAGAGSSSLFHPQGLSETGQHYASLP